jgi:hypothetical protein
MCQYQGSSFVINGIVLTIRQRWKVTQPKFWLWKPHMFIFHPGRKFHTWVGSFIPKCVVLFLDISFVSTMYVVLPLCIVLHFGFLYQDIKFPTLHINCGWVLNLKPST